MSRYKAETYKFFSDIIFKQTGMVYGENDTYRLDSRIKELITNFEFEDEKQLVEAFKNRPSADMMTILVNISTNNETYFFRDQKPFNALTDYMYLEVKKVNPGVINIWSAACSTGQEPLSILMSIQEKFGSSELRNIKLRASDVSFKALNKAKSGTYTGLEVQRGLPINLLMKYFSHTEEEDRWQVDSNLLNQIDFRDHNLLTGSFESSKFHIIFCRNVLIYQNKDNKNIIMNKLHDALKPGGFLVLGNGESLIGMDSLLQKDTNSAMTLYRRIK